MAASPTFMMSSGDIAPPPQSYTSVHSGADVLDEDTRYWAPHLQSFDAGFLDEKSTLDGRTEDSVRNSPNVAAAIRTQIYKTVGPDFRMSYEPDYKLAGMSSSEALKLIESTERVFAMDANSDENWFDASGRMTFTEIISCAMCSFFQRGEVMSTSEWLEPARNKGNRPFATSSLLINPDRVHTPMMMDESDLLKAGFRLSKKGYAYGMYVLNRHPGDFKYQNWADDVYAYIPRHTPWRRRRWLHQYGQEAVDQTRGRSQFITALRKNKAFDKLDDAMLSNVLIQTLYAAVVESPDPVVAMQGLMAADNTLNAKADTAKRGALATAQGDYYSNANELRMNRAKVAHMFPGDQFKFLQGNQGLEFYDPFQATVSRQLAKAFDLSYEEYTGDNTKTNYSGSRMGTNQSDTAREAIAARVPVPHARYLATNWLEENCSLGRLEGVPGRSPRLRMNWFLNNKDALSQFSFFGPGIKHIDPVKGTEAASNEMKMRVLTRRDYSNTYTNRNWRQTFDQLELEEQYATEKGIDLDLGLGIEATPVPAPAGQATTESGTAQESAA